MRSFSCGAGVEYHFGDDTPYNGSSGAGRSMNPDARWAGFPGSVDSAYLEHYAEAENGAVIVYSQKDCVWAQSAFVFTDLEDDGSKRTQYMYTNDGTLKNVNVFEMRSIRVPYGF